MIPPGFEPGTACVLDRSDNQLHHRTYWMEETLRKTNTKPMRAQRMNIRDQDADGGVDDYLPLLLPDQYKYKYEDKFNSASANQQKQ